MYVLHLTKLMHYFIFKCQIFISFYLIQLIRLIRFPILTCCRIFDFFNFCCNIQHQQEIHQSKYNYLIRLDEGSEFRESQIPTAPYLCLKYQNKNTNALDMHLRWSTIWITTNDHCDRSWGDCTMAISSLSQVSNIRPASVFVFGNYWYGARWTIRIPADDQNTFRCWSCSIICYTEMDLVEKIVEVPLDQLVNIPISSREWIISQLFPFLWIIIQNFSLQSICRRQVSGHKWRVSVRPKPHYIIMRELWWWFRFEASSIKPRKNDVVN